MKKIYFVGIGGIGMSALARYFSARGVQVSGYDLTESELTNALMEEGINIQFDQNTDKLDTDYDMVVYTPAVPDDQVLLSYLRLHDIPVLKRSLVLGLISKDKFTVAVAGTHGKTSTSAVLAYLLNHEQAYCSAFVGGILSNWNSNYQNGNSDVVVLEADEYDRSFLQLYPDILIINSLDADHLDIYENREALVSAYRQLIIQSDADASLLLTKEVADGMGRVWLGETGRTVFELGEDFTISDEYTDEAGTHFNYAFGDSAMTLTQMMPGAYNIANSAMAITAAQILGYSSTSVVDALSQFQGIKRRFEVLYQKDELVLVDDYAHHPTELSSVIGAVNSKYPNRKKLGIFQPHLFSRTKDFYREFAEALEGLDEVWILPIYPARELPVEGVDSRLIFNLIRSFDKKLVDHETMLTMLESRDDLELIITLGAGDIDMHHSKIINILAK